MSEFVYPFPAAAYRQYLSYAIRELKGELAFEVMQGHCVDDIQYEIDVVKGKENEFANGNAYWYALMDIRWALRHGCVISGESRRYSEQEVKSAEYLLDNIKGKGIYEEIYETFPQTEIYKSIKVVSPKGEMPKIKFDISPAEQAYI